MTTHEGKGNGGEKPFVRTPLDRVMRFDAVVPEKIAKKALQIAKVLDRYESAAASCRSDHPEDRLRLLEVMEADGVFSAAFAAEVESLGRAIRRTGEETARTMMVKGQDLPVYQRWLKKFDGAINDVIRKMVAERRPLFVSHMLEALQFSYLLSLQQEIRALGLQQVVANLVREGESGRTNPDQVALVDWYGVAQHVHADMRAREPGDLEDEEIVALTKELDFEPMPLGSIEVPSCGLTFGLKRAPMRLFIDVCEEQTPYFLVRFEMQDPQGVPYARGALSRATGDIIANGMDIIPAKEQFAYYGAQEKYTAIRSAVLRGLAWAIDEGRLKERTYINLDDNDIAAIRRLKPKSVVAPVSVSSLPEPQQLSEAKESKEESEPQRSDRPLPGSPAAETRPALSIDEQIALMNRPKTQRERVERVVHMDSRMTWRRIIAALRRCGVDVELNDVTHPKLRYEGRTTRFLNPHSQGTARNKQELMRVLKDLAIEKETLYARLK